MNGSPAYSLSSKEYKNWFDYGVAWYLSHRKISTTIIKEESITLLQQYDIITTAISKKLKGEDEYE